MKLNVLKEFRDKHNGKRYKPGATLDVTKERYEEIRNKDNTLVEIVEEPKPAVEVEEKPAEKKKPAKKSKE